ncbi:hypothetical protein R4P70_32205 [Rhodococcus sp. IEGM 1241]|uniref:hypothetical protein n=1 Tax=Rhodococcus sp. IEGM 1241 TaxID=3082228 RepID=UPI002955B2C6|nr:hypothetical protein [Rhodococcus sp. IEGM 1241]MDV8015978.1 hypothetical protein [Rhodococcus sp. IEGM 1241]
MPDIKTPASDRFVPDAVRLHELVRAMPGFPMHQHFDALNRASRVFAGNSTELYNLVVRFVGTDVMPSQMDDDYEHELVRLFHNYLASIGTLRDVQRAIHRTIWPMKAKDTPSEWEIMVYSPKVTELLGAGEIKFLQDLRNYTVHYALPVPSGSTHISQSGDGPWTHENRLRLEKKVLLRWSKWTSPARKFIETQPNWIDFLPAIEKNSVAVRTFYQWFWETIEKELSPEFTDFKLSMMELALYQAEENASRDWRIALAQSDDDDAPPTANLRRNLANARRQRWAHGSRGWRIFEVGTSNDVSEQINEDPWGLPPRSRS